jgi:hypothetical protein
MTRHCRRLAFLAAIVVGLTACSPTPSETEQRLAELEKQLEVTKQELAAKAAEAGAAASGAADLAAGAQSAAAAATEQAASIAVEQAGSREAAERAAQAADQASRDRAATDRALADQRKALADQNKVLADQKQALEEQKAATARQAEENERLRRELEEMKPREFTLPAGTVIPVRTTAALSTKSVKDGSVFDALLERDLLVDGTVLARAGSRVGCVVVSSDPGGRVKGVASLSVAARSIAGVGGHTLNVRTDSYHVEAGSTKGRDAARTGIAAGAGAVIGAIAGGGKGAAIGAGAGAAAGTGVNMATRGDPAVIPTETLIEFTLSAPSTVVIRK